VSNREELFWRIALNLVGVASLKKGAAGVGQTLDIADCQLPIADFRLMFQYSPNIDNCFSP
jgi:hypothetical protein